MDFSCSYHLNVEVIDNRDIVSIIEMIEISDPGENTFDSELHERAWYMHQTQPNILNKSSRKKIEDLVIKQNDPLEALMHWFDTNIDKITKGASIIGYILVLISFVVSWIGIVYRIYKPEAVPPTDEDKEVNRILFLICFLSLTIGGTLVFIINTKVLKVCFEISILAMFLLFCYIIPLVIYWIRFHTINQTKRIVVNLQNLSRLMIHKK